MLLSVYSETTHSYSMFHNGGLPVGKNLSLNDLSNPSNLTK